MGFIGTENYSNIFKDVYFQQALCNTVKFTVLAVITEVIIGLKMCFAVHLLLVY